MTYKAEIDGLRAVAVLSVILYHAELVLFGQTLFKGGFVGVDIFFVISGYLITRIILNELYKSDNFSFQKFYLRRARRILPMLVFILAACTVIAWQKLLPLDLVEFSQSALSALAFSSNIFFHLSSAEYGAGNSSFKPLLHTWSLGVEEQFYFIAPVLFLLIWKFFRHFFPLFIMVFLAMSILYADIMSTRNESLNFYLPLSRFWELFAGSIAAFREIKFEPKKNVVLSQVMPLLGLYLIIYSIFYFDHHTPHPSLISLLPVIGTVFIIFYCSSDSWAGRMLASKPFVGIGLLSYSAYLWHFPIFAFSRVGSIFHSNSSKLVWILLTLALY